jgi:carboxyl-terminal processing protease
MTSCLTTRSRCHRRSRRSSNDRGGSGRGSAGRVTRRHAAAVIVLLGLPVTPVLRADPPALRHMQDVPAARTDVAVAVPQTQTSNLPWTHEALALRAQDSGSVWKRDAIASFDVVWQTVNESFYDPAFGGLDWNAVRAELRPKAEASTSAGEVRRVITDMLARLKRSHFVVLSDSAVGDNTPVGEAAVPIDVRVTDGGLVISRVEAGSPAARDGLSAGQVILAIDTDSTADWKAPPAGPEARQRAFDVWRRAYRALHGDQDSRVTVRVRSAARVELDITTTRVLRGPTVTLGNLPPLLVETEARELTSPRRHRIGFIRFNVWMTSIDAPVAAAIDKFRKADGLVIDLRGNPGGLAVMISGISGHLLTDASALLGKMQTRQGQLEFRPNPRLSTPDGRRVSPYSGRVALLVDELTASTSECFAGALQSLGRARVFGRQTMGQALPALTKRLPNGDVLMYAVGDFVTSSGRSLEGEGVLPDETVPFSIRALAAGQDPDLEAALRWLDR